MMELLLETYLIQKINFMLCCKDAQCDYHSKKIKVACSIFAGIIYFNLQWFWLFPKIEQLCPTNWIPKWGIPMQ